MAFRKQKTHALLGARPQDLSVQVEQTRELKGEDPFSSRYRYLRTLAENEHRRVDLLLDTTDPNKQRRLVRKVRKTGEDIDGVKLAELAEREFDYLQAHQHPAFTRGFGFFDGQVNGEWVTADLREFILGKDLEELVTRDNRRDMPVQKSLSILQQALDALHYIHETGHYFRDFKPANIMVEDFGQKIRLADMDSLGRNKEYTGLSGSTFWVAGSDIWSHPYAFSTDMVDMSTELFSVGTTLYFLLTGHRPNIGKKDGQVVLLENEKVSLEHGKQCGIAYLEKKLQDRVGGPELIRTVLRLLDPVEYRQYAHVKEVMKDLEQIQHIMKHGYNHSDVDPEFLVNKPSVWRDWRERFQAAGSKIRQCSQDTYRFLRRTPIALGVLAGLGIGLTGYFITSNHLLQQSVQRAVHVAPVEALADDAHPIVQAAADINDLAHRSGALYVLNEGNVPKRPNAHVLLQKSAAILFLADETKDDLTAAKHYIVPFGGPIATVQQGGRIFRSAWNHSEDEHGHWEESCTRDADGNESCTDYYVCDGIVHTWWFNPGTGLEGARTLRQGLATAAQNHPERIDVSSYKVTVVPGTDEVGRPVTNGEEYLRGQNEWLAQGLLPGHDVIAQPNILAGIQDVRGVLVDAASPGGFHGLSGYELRTVKDLDCSSSDESSAPAGYIRAKRTVEAVEHFAGSYQAILTTLAQAPAGIDALAQELQKVMQQLEAGEVPEDVSFADVADRAAKLYGIMSPNTRLASLTKGRRFGVSLGVGAGLFLLSTMLGGAVQAHQGRRRYLYYS